MAVGFVWDMNVDVLANMNLVSVWSVWCMCVDVSTNNRRWLEKIVHWRACLKTFIVGRIRRVRKRMLWKVLWSLRRRGRSGTVQSIALSR